ncbi:TonB-dependent receptor domain-containing protein [Pseudoflavitalea rhizosphaerae]|uniref:TonB-dependent receptor domain-containing protein n=1 Tax=Pseudoflavitalea rhizosphaerae TaxID=1884793 RepID=UPI0019D2BD1A|nr:TonB-dependent receptor [Pseudoflavitalea rhizosphaerae]
MKVQAQHFKKQLQWIASCCLLLLMTLQGFGQQSVEVSGTVMSDKGDLLAGVTVEARRVPGNEKEKYTALTNDKGIFVFKSLIPGNKYDLSFSFVGYEANAFKAYTVKKSGEKNSLLIRLTQKSNQLDEVVVTGQGADISKRRLSSNVTTIKSSELENIPSGRFDQLLQSKLPNAQIRLTGGQSGATSIIRARGVSSAMMNSTPIIYVDGVRMDNLNTAATVGGGSTQGAAISSIADIPMDNIERVEYINGGAATTLYGSDAANGVIQIFTKKGSRNGTSITAEAQIGVEKSTNDFLFFDRTKDLLFETGTYQKYHMAINGGSDKFGYSFSGNFLNSSGVMLHNQNRNRKIDFSSGFRAPLGKKVMYESSFMFVNNQYKRNRNGNQGGYTGLWFAESGASAITGPRFNNKLDELTDSAFQVIKNYVDQAERLQDDQIRVNRFTTSQTFKYTPFKNLVVKVAGGIDYRVMKDQVVSTNAYISHTTGKQVFDQGSITNSERKYMGITLEANAQHTWKLGDFSLVTTVGSQFFRTDDQQVSYSGTNLRDGMRFISTAAIRNATDYYGELVNYGVYLQENIGYKNKLFLDLGVRGDGNPAFGDEIGIQYYPKAGVSYLLSEEQWFEPLLNVLSSARLRANFGIAGNLPSPWSNKRTMNAGGFLGEQIAWFGQPGNSALKPEKTQTTEFGMDLAFLNDRIRFSAGFYRSVTNDALFIVPAAPSTGQFNSQNYNVGKILNRGWEFNTVLVPVKTKDLTASLNFSVNTLYNRVLSSGGRAPFNINGFSARTIQTVVQEGFPVGYIRGNYGVFGKDGTLESFTAQSYLGTTIPDLFGSMGINVQYKQFTFFANADYQSGASANNWDAQFRYNYGADNGKISQAEVDKNGRLNWLNFTNMFIEKTDFIKVRTIGLLYNIKSASKSSVIKGLTIGLSAMNPLNFASSSFDPEATISGSAQGQGGATTGGISYATYSAPRQFIGTVRFNF